MTINYCIRRYKLFPTHFVEINNYINSYLECLSTLANNTNYSDIFGGFLNCCFIGMNVWGRGGASLGYIIPHVRMCVLDPISTHDMKLIRNGPK